MGSSRLFEGDLMERNGKLFERHVPVEGAAATKGGEILRAMNRIAYRWLNDGDICGVGYGRETVNPAARWLSRNVPGLSVLKGFSSCIYKDCEPDVDGDDYDKIMRDMMETGLDFLARNPNLLEDPNNEDCLESMAEDWDKDLPMEDDEDE